MQSTMTGSVDRSESARLYVLSEEQCVELLRAAHVGRVVVVAASGRPLIRPVNYKFDEVSGSIVFRSRRGSKLYVLGHADHACFEIDGGDQGPEAAWSVIVTGRVEQVTAEAEIARLERLGLVTWVGDDPLTWLRIHANVISGRRLGWAESPG